ncbi:MAG: hypothetical protein U1F36_14860 [Planctomycetota bacterium]
MASQRISPGNPPSWARPIVFGALHVVLVMLLLGSAMSMDGGAPTALSACCAFAFLPFGFLPAWLALRRDPLLSTGQGFAVSFIAVGLGISLWAVPMILSAPTPDPRTIRKAVVEWQKTVPEDSRMEADEVDRTVRMAVQVLPYLPALHAVWTTVLAGFVGMMTVARARRAQLPQQPPPDVDRSD